MELDKKARWGVIEAIVVSNIVSLVLFGLRIWAADNTRYWFLFWNLLLAWMPVLWAWLLVIQLKKHSWRDPIPVLLTLLWLGFLPNSFYLMSDLIHLHSTGDIGVLFDSVLFLSCIWNSLIAGIISLVWVHNELLKRKVARFATLLISLTIAITSFAIYLGRNLRWNTWDLLANPAALVFDVSEQIVNPLAHPQAFLTTLSFFVLIGSIYLVVWNFVEALTNIKPNR